MYVHQQDWANATRVSEAHDSASMGDILIAQAKACIERSEFTKAEALYVRAKKPELAVFAYKKANRWQDAIRIAREFLPHKVQELMGEHAAYMRGEQGLGQQSQEELMARGRQLEEGREFSQAIDAYLQVTAAQTKSHDFLEEVWENAVKLAMNHVPARIGEVVEIVSKRLIEISRFAQAAELYEGIDKHREAIAVYMQGGMWDQARELARQVGPKVEKEVNEAHRRSMAETGAAEDLVHSGNVAEGIEAYAQKGDWDKCREVAEQQGPHMLVKYASLHGAALIQQSTFAGAAKIFATYGTANSTTNVAMYRRLAKEILATNGDYDGGEVDNKSTRAILHLRQMLAKVVVGLRQAGDESLTREFENMAWIAHMTAAKDIAEERGATEARRKLALALLRTIRTIPADKAFYDAGQCCRQANDLSMAFVFLNRYLDITEAMEENEGTSTTLDNSDFADTGIPFDFPLPDKQFLADKDREKVRDYVLELSMNEKVQQSLNVAELDAVFKEMDAVRDAVQRNAGRGGANTDLFAIMRDTVNQV